MSMIKIVMTYNSRTTWGSQHSSAGGGAPWGGGGGGGAEQQGFHLVEERENH